MRLDTIHPELLSYFHGEGLKSRPQLSAEIWDKFGQSGAVLVLHMARFSSLDKDRSLVSYLALVAKMQSVVTPLLEKAGGALLKFEADGCYACFPKVPQAVAAAFEVLERVESLNAQTPPEMDIEMSVGVDCGEFLCLGQGEFFGEPVTVAGKLGEGLAQTGEVLVSGRAAAHLSPKLTVEETEFSHAGAKISAARVVKEQ